MMKRLSVISLALILAACGSSTKLESAATPTDTSTGAGTSQQGASSVQSIDLSANQARGRGPANVATTIYFDFDSYTIRAEAQPILEQHARFLNADRTRQVSLEGHTDDRGGREYNLALGQKRAEAVRRALTQLGVADSQLEAVSFGKEKPAVQGSDEAAYAQNRRVELNYK
ncbi:MAG: Peptidoglycan-associated lipoprotein [Paracidovorax wautersii]|uniref:Peptidoglycan-associated lipoprotein n=1 Tax=Paracidovorax wautersii TaxID=1177982 RepID=A0A7V8FM86_9BURK|nr:MAG: Peptidoglycan-associated lipoprotein [Paracidovorax wautersii]